jgi:hypothetical protein
MAQVDLDGIKGALKSILDAANTTTGSPIDLSNGLNTRVQRVMNIDPNRIVPQPSWFPFITTVVSDKDIEQITMGHAGSQASARREADITLDLFAACYEPLFSDINEDQGQENIEQLMENLEEVLRSNPKLSDTVDWAIPSGVRYGDIPYDEETHCRAGILTLECKVYY